ncbi:MAG: UDP-N-acetylmuramoyl-L-alanyl-D-glutamate--2,6-diaminopimelate ligase [Candidatus Eremiobacteraeota bacterium]|nr:UDP-N-acetylmuramoyl-L-alanyl-D-glutamate--2,6-diaminopimelate ligase [Candidatus Eremiobacteraeota bacterium]
MKLKELLHSIADSHVVGSREIDVTGIAYDSRQAFPGCLFCCIKGFKADGHDFIADALSRGAKTVCLEKPMELPDGVVKVVVPHSRRALALMSAEFYGHPSRKLKIIGVTGTNGKTTTTSLIEMMLTACGVKTGLIGTLFTKIGSLKTTSKVTTPESLDLQATLASMVDHGCECAVFEVSSHALELHRVEGCVFDRAVFTNLTQDHLDFHRNLEEYFQAKLKIFTALDGREKDQAAILNADDPSSKRIAEHLSVPALTYGVRDKKALYHARDPQVTFEGLSYQLMAPEGIIPVTIPVSGGFNVSNSLAAIAAASSLGVPPAELASAAREFHGVKGRFELIRAGQEFAVIVDYAHTPDGLENVLTTARQITSGSLITVFGCGGDRDRTKRPLMGGIAATLSDRIIITSDNPRTEEPGMIIADIEEGVRLAGKSYEQEADRRKAIFKALGMARRGDTVVIAGKGHENYQIFRDRTIHFDDGEVVHEFFKELVSRDEKGEQCAK